MAQENRKAKSEGLDIMCRGVVTSWLFKMLCVQGRKALHAATVPERVYEDLTVGEDLAYRVMKRFEAQLPNTPEMGHPIIRGINSLRAHLDEIEQEILKHDAAEDMKREVEEAKHPPVPTTVEAEEAADTPVDPESLN